MTDAYKIVFEVMRLKNLLIATYGEEQGAELIELADRFSKESVLAPNRALELAYQVAEEFGSESEDVFQEMHEWVERTAEDHHPHNTSLYLKALTWVILRRRTRA